MTGGGVCDAEDDVSFLATVTLSRAGSVGVQYVMQSGGRGLCCGVAAAAAAGAASPLRFYVPWDWNSILL